CDLLNKNFTKSSVLALTLLGTPLFAREVSYGDDQQKRLLRLSHQVYNLETEISTLKQTIENQENVIESVRSEVSKLIQATKESAKETASSQEGKLVKLE